MSEVIQSSNTYKTLPGELNRYRYARVSLNNITSSTVPIGATSSTLIEFRIPAGKVVNLARSYIQYQYTFPAHAAIAGPPVTNVRGVVYENGCDLARSVNFSDGGGLPLVDLQYADCYINTVQPIRTDLKEFLDRDQLQGMYPCNDTAANNKTPFSRDGATAGTSNASTSNYTEMKYLRIGGDHANGVPIDVRRQLWLSSFKDTLFSMDKNLVFGTDMYLRMQTQYQQRIGFYTTNETNPHAGVQPFPVQPMEFKNVYLFLALEENEVLKQSLVNALHSGKIKMSIPYMYTFRNSVAANTPSANFNVQLTSQYGRKIKKILFTFYSGGELNGGYAYDHSSVNGTKVTALQTSIDSRPLQDFYLSCYNPLDPINPTAMAPDTWADDYRENKKFLAGSCLKNYPEYQTNWFHIDSFGTLSTLESSKTVLDDSQIDDGFTLLNNMHVYGIDAKTPYLTTAGSVGRAQGLIAYTFVHYIRTLHITPQGLLFSS